MSACLPTNIDPSFFLQKRKGEMLVGFGSCGKADTCFPLIPCATSVWP